MYHRVAERIAGVESPTNNVTPARLRKQLSGLLARGFEPWPLSRVLDAYHQDRSVPSNAFVVTFDDGYENNLRSALPILRELHVPATLFLATGFLDSNGPLPSDDWSLAGSSAVPAASWRPLSTAQCHEMLDSGLIELGAHTHTHQFFVGRAEVFRRDLARCLEVLEERFAITRPSFAFPFGMMSPELIKAVRASGITCALSTRSERVVAGSEPFPWGRFAADDSDTAATLAAKLSGWYTPVAGAIRVLMRRGASSFNMQVASRTHPEAPARRRLRRGDWRSNRTPGGKSAETF
jgi:peptidoglycan/xylan/chitin deacetylase (PgdA/CDA1 family)